MQKGFVFLVGGVLVVATAACAWALNSDSTRDDVVAATSAMKPVCQSVDHLSLEQGHVAPYPILLIPDVGAEGDDSLIEWNYIWQAQDVVTAHCFSTPQDEPAVDVVLPKGTKRCVLRDKVLSCGQ